MQYYDNKLQFNLLLEVVRDWAASENDVGEWKIDEYDKNF